MDLLILGVGSYTRQLKGERVRPNDIDLRVVTSATPNSRLQEQVVRTAEEVTKVHLDAEKLDYKQKSGFDWHLVNAQGSDGMVTEIAFVDYDPNDIRFVVGSTVGRRAIDIIISGFGRFDIEGHLAKEAEMRKAYMVLADTRNS